MRTKLLTALLALAMLGAACSDDGGLLDDARPDTTAAPTTGADPDTDGNIDPDEVDVEGVEIEPSEEISGDEPVAQDADTVMIAAAIDVGAFWEATYPQIYSQPLPPLQGGFWSYGPSTPDEELPPCGGPVSYDDIAQNAFYCPADDLIAWDRDALVEPFIDEYGAFTAALVMAHEYGHAIQARSGDITALEQVISELQADCFAGAWVGHVVDGGSDVFRATIDELDIAVAGLVTIRDVPGSDPNDPAAHGSGFDRVSAFSDGIFAGAARCADYGNNPPVVTQQVFESAEDAASGGNLSTAELLPLLYADLEDFYAVLFTELGLTWTPVNDILFVDPSAGSVTCGAERIDPDDIAGRSAYCVPDNVVLMDAVERLPALEEIGDFAIAADVARQWAFAAQVQMGNLDDTPETSLHADCLTGLYAGDVFFNLRPSTAQLVLSPGDLDEAIISFLADTTASGTPFERSDAFRTGFLGFVADCDAYLQGG